MTLDFWNEKSSYLPSSVTSVTNRIAVPVCTYPSHCTPHYSKLAFYITEQCQCHTRQWLWSYWLVLLRKWRTWYQRENIRHILKSCCGKPASLLALAHNCVLFCGWGRWGHIRKCWCYQRNTHPTGSHTHIGKAHLSTNSSTSDLKAPIYPNSTFIWDKKA